MKKKTKLSKVAAPKRVTTKRAAPTKKKIPLKTNFPIVGIGASAGGLEALKELFSNLPSNTGMAFVVIQHLDPKHESLTAEILARSTKMPLAEIEDGMQVEPNHVYVIPPNRNLGLSHGKLKLLPRIESRVQHMPLDFFYQTLADERKNQAVGVVLSGTASDGTNGLRSIKAEGGFTLVQEPKSAKYDGMPKSAIASGAVDFISTPKGIAVQLARTAKHPYLIKQNADSETAKPLTKDESLTRIFSLLQGNTRIDFSHYKKNTIHRRIARRMLVQKTDDFSKYVKYLESHPEEIKALFADILIHVTSFFRDKKVFEALKTKILPKYMKNRDPNLPFRIWVAGCSTGEEVYSLAMTFIEFQDEFQNIAKKTSKLRTPLSIFGTDISEQALDKARKAIYPESISEDVSPERLRKFFDKVEGGGYRIAKWLRDYCLFSKHDVTRDPPFAKVDLISCRNVLIYFDIDLHKFVLPIFHYALNPNGILVLGKSETVGGFANIFSLADKTNKIYSKKNVTVPLRIKLPLGRYSTDRLEVGAKKLNLEPGRVDFQRESDRIALSEYAPPSVVINDALEIVQSRGRTSPFLELSPGQPSLNLLRMAHPELVGDLRVAIQAARKNNSPVIKTNLSFRDGGSSRSLTIKVVPIPAMPLSKDRYFTIFFEETKHHAEAPVKARPQTRAQAAKEKTQNEKHHLELKKKLAENQDYQQSLIEEYETSQEELVSSNEELQSTNEELQSTNEELETAKEELQSSNEELTTINDELQTRNIETINLNNDLTNLLASVDIPIVMVSSDGKIRRFTPKAAKIMKLITADVGRSIGDIKPNIRVPDLDHLVFEVIDSMAMKELETQDKDGHWYQLQVRPYRTADNKIDGAVIALIDIDMLKQHAEALKKLSDDLKKAHDDAATIIESQPIPLLVIDSDQRVKIANEIFYQKFNVSRSVTEGRIISELGSGQWKISELRSLINKTLSEGVRFEHFEVAYDFPHIGRRVMLLSSRKVQLAGSGETAILLAIDDVTERISAEKALKYSEEKYRNLIANAYDGIVIVRENGNIEFSNRQIEKMFGYTWQELHDKPIELLVPDRFKHSHVIDRARYSLQAISREMGANRELLAKRKDGSEFPVEISLTPVKTAGEFYVTAIVRDITERKEIEKERAEILLKEQRANQVKDEFLAMLSHELRTPLTSILAWSQMLLKGNLEPEKIRHGLMIVEQSAKAQGQLINDLLDISRIQAGKLNLSIQEIDPALVIAVAIDSTRSLAAMKSIQIETKIDPSVKNIYADPMRLQQILWNLITNSIKFSGKDGKIRITLDRKTKASGQEIQIQVHDNGKGIKADFVPIIFDSFTQVDSSSTRSYGGLGLGLAIVRRLVEMHGGTVKVESPGENLGATFTIFLPVKLNHVISKAEAEAEVSLRGLRILVVDDELNAREVFSVMLQSFGAEVKTAGSVSEALVAFKEFRPDVLVSDISMPLEDGYSLISKIRALKSVTPALALTANAAQDDVQRALVAGFQAHLAKPVEANKLALVIARLVGRL